jgi:hypothetical protein
MQGKGFIKFMAILLGIVCVYSLSFNLVTSNVEKNAKAYARAIQREKELFWIPWLQFQFIRSSDLTMSSANQKKSI